MDEEDVAADLSDQSLVDNVKLQLDQEDKTPFDDEAESDPVAFLAEPVDENEFDSAAAFVCFFVGRPALCLTLFF